MEGKDIPRWLSDTSCSILFFIYENNGAKMSEIARFLGVSLNYVSRYLYNLRNYGLLSKCFREWQITQKGLKVLEIYNKQKSYKKSNTKLYETSTSESFIKFRSLNNIIDNNKQNKERIESNSIKNEQDVSHYSKMLISNSNEKKISPLSQLRCSKERKEDVLRIAKAIFPIERPLKDKELKGIISSITGLTSYNSIRSVLDLLQAIGFITPIPDNKKCYKVAKRKIAEVLGIEVKSIETDQS